MILLISTCKNKLHELEFVNPIEDILKKNNIKYFKKHYSKIKPGDKNNSDKVIICGTSLKDMEYLEASWIIDLFIDKSLLGICAGMQLISINFENKRQVKKLDIKNNLNHFIKKKQEIGFYKENFIKNFLGLKGNQEVYHLHNNYTKIPEEFESYTDSKIPQAIKHNKKLIYGVLFHPEIRNQQLIINFLKDS